MQGVEGNSHRGGLSDGQWNFVSEMSRDSPDPENERFSVLLRAFMPVFTWDNAHADGHPTRQPIGSEVRVLSIV